MNNRMACISALLLGVSLAVGTLAAFAGDQGSGLVQPVAEGPGGSATSAERRGTAQSPAGDIGKYLPGKGPGSGRSADEYLALRLLEGMLGDRPDDNLLISPASLVGVLKLLAEGASASAREAIYGLVGGPPAPSLYPTAGIGADSVVTLRESVALFGGRSTEFLPAYRSTLQDRYQALVESLDFSEPSAVKRVNRWVRESTAGHIESLVDELPEDTLFVVLNALYFKGDWANPFDPRATLPAPFTTTDGQPVEVPTMRLPDVELPYREDRDFQALELAYEGARYRMVLVLPREPLGPATLARLTRAKGSWLMGEGYRRGRGRLRVPRFTLACRSDLLERLKALGLKETFTAGDSFSGIAAPAPQVTRVLQKTLLRVNEEGSEAAAVTAAVATRSIVAMRRFDVSFDRPFLFAIRDDWTGRLLFAGRVADPARLE